MQYTLANTINTPSGTLNASKVVSGDVNLEADFTVGAGATNTAETISIIQSTLVAVVLLFNATGATPASPIGGHLTLKTNSSGSPQETITLNDGVPLVYPAGGVAIPFAGNVTAFYMTDASTGAVGGILHVRALTNQ